MLKPRTDLNLNVRHQGFPYQVDAVEAIKGLPYAAVFHEQGLGKTKIAIDLALNWLETNTVDSVIIVTKRGLIKNWKDEFEAHAFMKVRVLEQDRASNFFALNSATRIFLTHYEVLRSEERRMRVFLDTRRVAVILDEAQKIKNPDSALAQTFHRLSPAFVRKVIMTGTPVANRPYDLWSQVHFLDQGRSLGTDFEKFQRDLDLGNDLWSNDKKRAEFERALADVFRKIQPFTVRETKKTAGIQLPDKLIENVYVDAAPVQRRLYDQFRFQVRAEVLKDGHLVEDDAEQILKRLLRLVQVASNPDLVDESYAETPGKYPALLRLLEKVLADKSKVIVWTNFVANAEWLNRKLKPFGCVMVHGSRSIDERNAALHRFKTDNATTVLIATPGAAKEGLTLTVANHAVFYDRSFSLDDYLQAQDRIHRISQTATCYIWNLICRDTVDEWVDSLLSAKRLAAQLAQSDITAEAYREQANYDFGRLIEEILGEGRDG